MLSATASKKLLLLGTINKAAFSSGVKGIKLDLFLNDNEPNITT